ncbi:MAG TPA: RNA-binding protein hfq [Leptolyngbyaceae cyanobacterium]
MTTGFDTGLPSTRQLQSFIKEEKQVDIKLMTGDLLSGQVRWQDPTCISLIDENSESIIIWRQAIAYIKLKG